MPAIALLATGIHLGGCAVRAHASASAVIVHSPPPKPVVLAPLTCPAGHVYVEGRYHWNGAAWVWVDHACYHKPGYVWIAPTYVVVQGGVRYYPGHWKPAGAHAKPAPKHHKAAPPKKASKPHPVVKAKPVD
jgi:hypothetical protein